MGVADTRYSTHAWDEQPNPAIYTQPSSQWEIKRIAEALESNRAPGDVLAMQRCPLPQVGAAPRYGYDRRALGVLDVLAESRLYPTNANDFSGSLGGYAGSIRNSLAGA